MTAPDPDTIARFFVDDPVGLAVHDRVTALLAGGDVSERLSRSQIAFRRRRGFAWLWRPDRWLHGDVAPVVLSVSLPRQDGSPRWKEVVHPTASAWLHHLEVRRVEEIDDQVADWLTEARDAAG